MMKSFFVSIVVVTGLTFSGSAMSVDMPAIAKKNGCANCHAIEKKLVGPAWQAVAEKYKGDATAVDKLNLKIAKGGSGVWGPVPMPAQPKLSDGDRHELIEFILGLAK